MAELNLKNKFIHRDLSWLSFNERVLEEALDPQNPLLEKLKFLAIFVSNLDEFYMVRVAGLKRVIDLQLNQRDSFGYYPTELWPEIKSRTDELIKKLYEIYEGKVKKDLEKNKIYLKSYSGLNSEQLKFVKKFFDTTIFPIVTPMAVDQGHPFPALPSRTIAFAVNVSRKEEMHLAILSIPSNVPQVIKLPSEKGEFSFILVEELLKENLKNFFRGFKIESSCLFRILRDGELSVEEEITPDLLKAIENEVRKRSRAKVVYMEVEKSCAPELLQTLCAGLEFPPEEVIPIGSDMDITFLHELVSKVDKPELCFPSFVRGKIPYDDIFDKMNESDFIVHLPFQTFFSAVDLIEKASKDPHVLAIKMTLYRTNEDSVIIKALKEAAKNKKQVTVLVEIKARFDEEKNIIWAKELEDAGCHVIYGIPKLKIHSKMTLIVRREEERIRRYVHLSTGNYNEKTAKVYTDFGYFTGNDDFAKDISDVFNVLTGYSIPTPWKRIISSPYDLRKYFFDLIDREIYFQKKNKNGLIIAKMNSLEDTPMIDRLYEASQAGVKIKLIVRGICCLIPGVEGLSENIEVKSIVGRFLEHSRVYLFHNNGTPRIFLASADWMTRNFDRRVELLFEIYKEEIKEHLRYILDLYGKDNLKSRILGADKSYTRPSEGDEKFNVQEYLIKYYGG